MIIALTDHFQVSIISFLAALLHTAGKHLSQREQNQWSLRRRRTATTIITTRRSRKKEEEEEENEK